MYMKLFLHPETIIPIGLVDREEMPKKGEIIKFKGRKYKTFKTVWFFGDDPFIAVKRLVKKGATS